jgi:hypothetical protein
MAQYDVIVNQNVATSGEQYIQRTVTGGKGRLLTFDSGDIPATLPVGTDGYVLTADSAEATGLKWAVASGGASDVFKTWTIQADSGYTWGSANVVASGDDTMDLVAGSGIAIDSDSTLKAFRIRTTGSGGLTSAYVSMTDGTTTASASGGDTFKFRSADNKLTVAVTDNDATHGDNLLITVNEANINHDNLAGFDANEHFLQSAISITASQVSDFDTEVANNSAVVANTAKVTMTYPGAGIALSTGSAWDTSITNNSANWNTAFGWGDHDGLYDPVGSASSAVSTHETTFNHANYNTAYSHSQIITGNPHDISWSDLTGSQPAPIAHTHTVSDITDFAAGVAANETSHADVLVDGDFTSQGLMRRGATAGSYSIVTDNSANWNTAFSWGDHDGLYEPDLGNPAGDGYVLSSTAAGVRSWVSQTGGMVYPGAGIAVSTGSAWGTSITDNSTNWNTAYSHSQLTSGNPHSVAWTELTGVRSGITLSGFNDDLTYGTSDVSVSNQGNDRVITATATTDDLNAETNLTYNTTQGLQIASGTGIVFASAATTYKVYTASGTVKANLTIETGANSVGGAGDIIIVAGAGSAAGGNVYFRRDTTYGNFYFGTGAAGHLPARSSETNVIFYDTDTGLLSYGPPDVGGYWTDQTTYLIPTRAADSVRLDGTTGTGFYVTTDYITGMSAAGTTGSELRLHANNVNIMQGFSGFVAWNVPLQITNAAAALTFNGGTTGGTIKTGDSATSATGPLHLTTGDATEVSPGDNSGNILIYPGASTAGSRGQIYFGEGSAASGALQARSAETNVVYYDTDTGKLSYGAAGNPAYGTDNQIPVMNSGGTGFEYTPNLTYGPSNNFEVVSIIRANSTSGGTSNYTTLTAGGMNMYVGSTQRVLFQLDVTNGASAVAIRLGSHTNLTTTGAKLLNVSNAGTERFFIDKDGGVFVSAGDGVTGTVTIAGGNAGVTALDEIAAELKFNSNDGSVTSDTGGKIAILSEATNGANWGMGFFTYQQTGDLLLEKLRITNNGIVKVLAEGTATASAPRLRIENTHTSIDTGNDYGSLEFYANDASTGGTGISGHIKNVATNAGVTSSLEFGIRTDSSGTAATRMTLNSSGLSITGTMAATAITVTSTSVVTNLNADRVDSLQASSFLRSDASDSATGTLSFSGSNNQTAGYLRFYDDVELVFGSNNDWDVYYSNANNDLYFDSVASTSDINFSTGGNVRFRFDMGTFAGTATDWIATSDVRVKTNIRPFELDMDKFLYLGSKAIRHNWKEGWGPLNSPEIGFIAQDIEKFFPELVSIGAKKPHLRGISYGKMVTVAIKAAAQTWIYAKEIDARVVAVESEVDKLKKKIDKLQIELNTLKNG